MSPLLAFAVVLVLADVAFDAGYYWECRRQDRAAIRARGLGVTVDYGHWAKLDPVDVEVEHCDLCGGPCTWA